MVWSLRSSNRRQIIGLMPHSTILNWYTQTNCGQGIGFLFYSRSRSAWSEQRPEFHALQVGGSQIPAPQPVPNRPGWQSPMGATVAFKGSATASATDSYVIGW
jgi:hypothetical protein